MKIYNLNLKIIMFTFEWYMLYLNVFEVNIDYLDENF